MKYLNFILLLTTASLWAVPEKMHNKNVLRSGDYVSATKKSDITTSSLQSYALMIGQPKVAAQLTYGVRSYTLVYETMWNDKLIQVSGLILIPTGIKTAAPVISVQHGTAMGKNEAPSVASYTGMELFASAGYIVLMPDYIGYGKSAEIFHPYYDKKHSAMTVIDMISAAKQFLKKEGVLFNDKLFLAGYSEGGYVTMAAAQEIEKNAAHKLTLTAIAAGAGGYSLSHMLQQVTSDSYYAYPAYLAFVLMAYNNTYQWNKPLHYFFKREYADALTKYMNGTIGGNTINSKLSTHLPTLFEQNFYKALKTQDGERILKQALQRNSIGGWKTETPIQLYHGSRDEIIPYENTEVTAKSFKEAGSLTVSIKKINGGTHGSTLYPMMEMFVPWFLSLR